jgi:glycosyltransferase involved in cell wall biosynthesis
MHNSHCFVLSSNYETFGVVLIEALASGLPIVATSCGGPQEIVDESNGILVKPNCISSLSAGMRYMYINHVKYSRARLRADALKTYGPMAFVKNAESLYSQTLSSTP